AVGIYPISTTNIYTEQSTEEATDFLGTVVKAWEVHASQIANLGIRTCYTRFGVVLGDGEGALPMMLLPYKLFAGGTIGSGEQWLSWIHVDDLVRAILHVIEHEQMEGIINFTSPNPKRMRTFGKIIGDVTKRPHWLPVPSFALQLVLGEKSTLVLDGQYVIPEKLLASNFKFKYASLSDALSDLLT
ncbi:MAG: TIGR01777 family oxidoreductase, partial [Lysinibacillus sp.]